MSWNDRYYRLMWRKTRQPVNNIAYRTSEAAATARDKLGHSAGDVMIVTRIRKR